MRTLNYLICVLFSGIVLSSAKDSLETVEAFRKYRNREPLGNRGAMSDKEIEFEISRMINDKEHQIPFVKALEVLEVVRGKSEKNQNIIKPLKELWSFYHTRTFRSKEPEYWSYMRCSDNAQMICDEIKILIRSIGGNIDDIEPVSERNTFEAKELWRSLESLENGIAKHPVGRGELNAAAAKLSAIVARCTFGAGSDDEIFQLQYIYQIIQILGDRDLRAGQMPIGKDDPIVKAYNEALSKSLPLIDDKWVQKPTGNKGPNPGDPSAEQVGQWRKNSLEGSQQGSIRKIRDQILLNVSNWINENKEDAAFRQEMLNRFGKNVDLRRSIEERVGSID